MVNLLSGNDGADIPAGGQGHDTLQGGTGKDVLTGGLGSDVFFFAAKGVAGFGDTRGRITEFASSTDKPDFHSFMVDEDFTGNAFFSAGHGPQVRYVAFTGLLTGDPDGNGRCPSSDGP